ncbi:MAG: alpha/beta hydrolase [Propionibacteriales bacterium]|nr:alpha/beta hydrolase [Propionibacteriales bacterium]
MTDVRWHSDLLEGYECHDVVLDDAVIAPGEPTDTDLVATLVRRIAEQPSRRAILYVHGWNDYFFQSHLGDHWAAQGYDFYAVDLRRYGRSLRRGQLPGFVSDLGEYAGELDACVAEIRADHDLLLLMGHSTGGLIAAVWVADHPGKVDGLVLNSPWLDLQATTMVRTLGTPVIDTLGGLLATTALPMTDAGFYARALHSSQEGEWDYDLDLKSSPAASVRVGWLRAVLQGHQRVARGLGIEVPVLVMCSDRTVYKRRWDETMRRADTVLDVSQIAARAPRLGSCVTLVRIAGGMHDLVLSAQPARDQVFTEMVRWTRGYVD